MTRSRAEATSRRRSMSSGASVKPGALIHLRLPHASSALAVSRDPRPKPLLTLNTFNYYDPRSQSRGMRTRRRRSRSSERGCASPRAWRRRRRLALARGPFAQFIEKLANGSRGSQYRFERWFAPLFGGFEEFEVVLGVVKPTDARPPEHVAATAGANGIHEDVCRQHGIDDCR